MLESTYIERAEALTLFGRFDEAHNALAIARKNLKPGVMRWEVNLWIEEAKTYYAQKEYDDCCTSLLSALKLVREVNLQSKEDRIIELYQQCSQKSPRSSEVRALGKMLGLDALAS